MEILFNGQPLSIEGITAEMTILDLISVIDEQLAESEMTLMEVAVDSQSFAADDRESLGKMPLAGHEKIQLIALTPPDMVVNALLDADEAFSHLNSTNSTAINHLRIGKIKEAMDPLVSLFDGLEWILRILKNLHTAFPEKMGEANLEQTRADLTARIREHMGSLEQAQKSQDWVGTADVLEYEFSELFKECHSFFKKFQQT